MTKLTERTHARARILAAVAGSILAATMIAGRTGSAEVATHTVTVENMRFNPEQLSIHRGDRVVWVNKDLVPHTVTADGKAFDSGDLPAGQSWTYVDTAAGRYSYRCSYHPTMKGMLIVQ